MSRPSSSVPHQWAEDGVARRVGKIDVGGILRRDPGGEEGEDYEDDHQHDAGRRQRIVAGGAGERDGGGGHGNCYNLGNKLSH